MDCKRVLGLCRRCSDQCPMALLLRASGHTSPAALPGTAVGGEVHSQCPGRVWSGAGAQDSRHHLCGRRQHQVCALSSLTNACSPQLDVDLCRHFCGASTFVLVAHNKQHTEHPVCVLRSLMNASPPQAAVDISACFCGASTPVRLARNRA